LHLSDSWVALQSRRGMKELDLIFQQFNNRCYAQLSSESQALYHQLLQEQDGDLWRWCFHLEAPPAHYSALLARIAPDFPSGSK